MTDNAPAGYQGKWLMPGQDVIDSKFRACDLASQIILRDDMEQLAIQYESDKRNLYLEHAERVMRAIRHRQGDHDKAVVLGLLDLRAAQLAQGTINHDR